MAYFLSLHPAFGYFAGSPPQLGEDGKYQVSELKVIYEKMVAEYEIDLDMGFIMMPDAIPAAKPSEPHEPPEPPQPSQPEEQKSVSISFSADRDQLYAAWQAVANLANMAGKVSVNMNAEREEGFDKNKLRNAVIEHLQEADLIK